MTMRKEELTIAFYQQDICWECPGENYRLVEDAFEPVGQKADVLVVPETFTTGFSDQMAALAEESGGETLNFALRMAQCHDALFVGTWPVKTDEGVYNRLHWVRPDGTWGSYDKGHTFRVSTEAAQLQRGTRREIFEWRGWRIKPAVCYDLRFPKWLRTSNPPDYDLLLFCANWPGSRCEAWTTLLKARAIENLCYVLGVNRVGTDGLEIPYTGDSALYDYKGSEICRCEPGVPQLKMAAIDYQSMEGFRQRWPFYLDFD